MRRNFVITLCCLISALLCCNVEASDKIEFPPAGSFILPTSVAEIMFKQCSRPVPQHADGYWEPSAQDIGVLENDLRAYVAMHVTLFPLHAMYNRQYIGFTRADGHYIYGNFYPSDMGKTESKQGTVPVIMCDGGSGFWGIVYDTQTHTFEMPQFNGSI
jgi:hypothetical protein